LHAVGTDSQQKTALFRRNSLPLGEIKLKKAQKTLPFNAIRVGIHCVCRQLTVTFRG